MKKALKVIVIFLAITVLFAGTSFAGWYSGLEVTRVNVSSEYYIITTSSTQNLCGSEGRFIILASDLTSREMFSVALSAFLSEKNIKVHSEDPPDCVDGGVPIDIITILGN